MPALVPARAGERVQHGGVGVDVQAGARRERRFVEQRADGVVLALAVQHADDHLCISIFRRNATEYSNMTSLLS